MELAKVSFENILAGLLLKFGKVSKTDIDVVTEMLLEKHLIKSVPSPYAIDYRGISNYVVKYGENYYMIDTEEAKEVLKKKQGEFFYSFVASLNVEELVIRKLGKLKAVPEHNISNVFSEKQEVILDKMKEDNLVVYVWNDDIPHDDYLEVQLTQLGEVKLFKYECKFVVDEFKELLMSCGYDVNLIDDFFRVQDFTKDVYDILNLDNFLFFCSTYDRAAVAEGNSLVNYRKVKFSKENGFDKEAKEMFRGMLAVWDDGHCIYICHPNHIFSTKYLTEQNHNIQMVNWDAIDYNKMVEVGDYKTFISPDSQPAFRYVHKRLGHQVMKKIELGQEETSFLVVVEKYILDGEDNYVVRGIIKGDKEGYSLGFNPEYEKVIPKSVWESSLRFSGHDVPGLYLKKRLQNNGLKN